MSYEHREGMSRLIYRPNDPERPTARKDCGAREAAALGLAEYLKQLRLDAPGGRAISFKTVKVTYGDLWTPAELPAANIHGGVGEAEYDPAGTGSASPITGPAGEPLEVGRDRSGDRAPPQHKFAWFTPSTFEATFTVEVWAGDLAMRKALELMLEDDLNPVPDWLSGGFRLELPHYCGARANYHLVGGSIGYSAEEARQGVYKSVYSIEVSLDLRVPRARPRMLPSATVDAGDGVGGRAS